MKKKGYVKVSIFLSGDEPPRTRRRRCDAAQDSTKKTPRCPTAIAVRSIMVACAKVCAVLCMHVYVCTYSTYAGKYEVSKTPANTILHTTQQLLKKHASRVTAEQRLASREGAVLEKSKCTAFIIIDKRTRVVMTNSCDQSFSFGHLSKTRNKHA